jgi:hypothetical protein
LCRVTRADLCLVNQAVRGRWDPPAHVKRAVVERIVLRAFDDDPNVHILLFAVRILIRMDEDNLESEAAALTILQDRLRHRYSATGTTSH